MYRELPKPWQEFHYVRCATLIPAEAAGHSDSAQSKWDQESAWFHVTLFYCSAKEHLAERQQSSVCACACFKPRNVSSSSVDVRVSALLLEK